MANNAHLLGTEEIKARLYELISYMSESEKQDLQSTLIYGLSKTERRKILSILVSNISETKRLDLLKKLELRQQSKISNKRQHPRKSSLIAVECQTHDVSFTNFIQDVSNGGVFIETDAPFFVGQEIIMNFSLPNLKFNQSIAVRSEVVRVDSIGIGVKFKRPIRGI